MPRVKCTLSLSLLNWRNSRPAQLSHGCHSGHHGGDGGGHQPGNLYDLREGQPHARNQVRVHGQLHDLRKNARWCSRQDWPLKLQWCTHHSDRRVHGVNDRRVGSLYARYALLLCARIQAHAGDHDQRVFDVPYRVSFKQFIN